MPSGCEGIQRLWVVVVADAESIGRISSCRAYAFNAALKMSIGDEYDAAYTFVVRPLTQNLQHLQNKIDEPLRRIGVLPPFSNYNLS